MTISIRTTDNGGYILAYSFVNNSELHEEVFTSILKMLKRVKELLTEK